jgi:sigma-B regulation protein RsbU (phosphoserine phosphatase)
MEPLSYRYWRGQAIARGWYARSVLARFTLYLLGLDLLVWILRLLFRRVSRPVADTLAAWLWFLTFISLVLLLLLALRWLRRVFMWRLRNRLIVTYMFMAVIPVALLLALALGSLYLFAGQFATFLVTSEINSELKSLQTANEAIGHELAVQLEHGRPAASASLEGMRGDPDWKRREVIAWHRGKPILVSGAARGTPQVQSPPGFAVQKLHQVMRDRDKLYLRALTTIPTGGDKLTVVSSEPLNNEELAVLAADLGRISIYGTGFRRVAPVDTGKGGAQGGASNRAGKGSVSVSKDGQVYELETPREPLSAPMTAGTVPAAENRLDGEVTFGTSIFVVDWQTGKEDSPAAVSVQTRVSKIYGRLFAALGDFAPAVEYFLTFVAVVFGVIELLALFVGVRLTRTITRSVAALYNATQHINRGDFSHRIVIRSQDQLAALEGSFNSMTESIQKLLAEQQEKQRIENELAIAQEVQAQLFPRQFSSLESLEVHGYCRPARTVSGDYYDFLTASSHKLTLAVGDISGKGISAALLMATIHSAVRAYALENAPALGVPAAVGAGSAGWPHSNGHGERSPSALLSLLNHQLYESTPAEKYATLFLGIYDGTTRKLVYSNGGHLPPLLIGRDGNLRRLECGGMVVGLFDRVPFEQDSVNLAQGDIFLAFSDGITEAENDFGEFGEARLVELVRDHRDLPLPLISEMVTAAVDDWVGGQEQTDDITLVLARAR